MSPDSMKGGDIMNREDMKTMRVNIRVSEKINNYFINFSNELGISRSSAMCIALQFFMKQQPLEFYLEKNNIKGEVLNDK